MKEISEKEEGYLSGLFEGDGYKYYDKKGRHYQTEFYLNSEKDKEIIAFLLEILNKLNLNPQKYFDKRFACLRTRINSKELFNNLNKNKILDMENEDFCIGYLSGLIDSDGYVNSKKYSLNIINTNKNILENCQKFLKKKEIESTIKIRKPSKKDKQKSYILHISVNFKRLPHISIKVKKLHSGMEQSG